MKYERPIFYLQLKFTPTVPTRWRDMFVEVPKDLVLRVPIHRYLLNYLWQP